MESLRFEINIAGNAIQGITKTNDAMDKLTATIDAQTTSWQKLKSFAFNFNMAVMAVNTVTSKITNTFSQFENAYNIQAAAETKLETVMRQRLNATDDQIESIKRLASAQQALGVIGDEVQLSGAQQLATFVSQKESIDALLPSLNNLLAQQKGLNATEGDAVNIGNLMGKVLQGQTSSLSRVGISFTEAEEKVLKYGNEAERAAMLAQVITNNVGEMNAALANTPEGRLKQHANTMGDIQERAGAL